MGDEIVRRDGNYHTVGAVITNDSDQDIVMIRLDPVTKEVLVDISDIGSTSSVSESIAQRDQNYKTVCLAYDETNNILQEVLTDSEGNILCDVEM